MTRSAPPWGIRENVPLAPFTTLGIGGPARYYAEARTESQILAALEFAERRKLPVFILGGGSNIVVSDTGFPGLVIRIALRGLQQKDPGRMVAAAGEDWDAFVQRCVRQNLAGIECLSGIPGTVGATPMQNVGAYGQEVSAVIDSVRALDRKSLQTVELRNEECGFGYRTSFFSRDLPERFVILSVQFALHPKGEPCITYPDLRSWFAEVRDRPGLVEVREAVLRIRERKSMLHRPGDPDARSAGSFFKNPVLAVDSAANVAETAKRMGLLRDGETLPRYAQPDNRVKISAAWLIEHAGYRKGMIRGHVGLSSRHNLALINCGGATARELLEFAEEIRAAVHARFGIELVREPTLVGVFEKQVL